jgi:hypothetical protein
MDNVKHTPGPYDVRRCIYPTDGTYDYAISAPGAKVMAETFGRAADGMVLPAEANAKRIALALECHDDMLEALHDLLTRPTDGAARERARAAIAKARGGGQ